MFLSYDIEEFLANAVAVLLFLGGLFAVIMSLWWGFRMVISGWKDEKLKPAKTTVKNAFIGIILLILIIFILPVVGRMFWIDLTPYVSPENIFTRIGWISQNILYNSTSDTENFFDSSSFADLPL